MWVRHNQVPWLVNRPNVAMAVLQVLELVSKGSVINGAYPVQFLTDLVQRRLFYKHLCSNIFTQKLYDWGLLYSILSCTAIVVAVLQRKQCRHSQEGCQEAGHPFLLLGEQQEEALNDEGHQLKNCPCPKCGLSLFHLFLMAGPVSTKPPAPPALIYLLSLENFWHRFSKCGRSLAAQTFDQLIQKIIVFGAN